MTHDLSPVKVSVRFTYQLREGFADRWSHSPPSFDSDSGGLSLSYSELGQLPFGAAQDPLKY